MQAAATARACGCGRTPRRTRAPELARWQIDARRGRHLLRQARRGRGVRRRRHRRYPPALSAQSGQRRPRARAARSRRISRSSSMTSASRAAGRTRCSAPARSVDVLVKVDVGFHRCGIDPDGAARADFVRARRGDAGTAFPRPAQPRRPRLRRGVGRARSQPIARARGRDADATRGRRRALGVAVDEISVGATPTARFSAAAEGSHRAAAGQLRLLRPHPGRARRRVAATTAR